MLPPSEQIQACADSDRRTDFIPDGGVYKELQAGIYMYIGGITRVEGTGEGERGTHTWKNRWTNDEQTMGGCYSSF